MSNVIQFPDRNHGNQIPKNESPAHDATGNREYITELFSFGRTTWTKFARSEQFPQPTGYADRFPIYRVSEVARFIYDNAPAFLLKTPAGNGYHTAFSLLRKFDKTITADEFAALVQMDGEPDEFAEFLGANDVEPRGFDADGQPFWGYLAAVEYAVEHFEALAGIKRLFDRRGDHCPEYITELCRDAQDQADALRAQSERFGFDLLTATH